MPDTPAMSEDETGAFLRERLLPGEPEALVAVWLHGSAALDERLGGLVESTRAVGRHV